MDAATKRSHHQVNLSLPPTVQWHQSNLFSDDNDLMLAVSEKIQSAFSKVDPGWLIGVIQFWAPVKQHGRRMLTTCNQPFICNYCDDDIDVPRYQKYRLLCESHRYNLDDDDDDQQFMKDDVEIKMINGPPATAFLNHLPDVVVDMNSLKGSSPLMDAALDCELTCYFMLPVFYPSLSPYCVGVVECSVENFEVFKIFQQVKHALKSVRPSTFGVQQCLLDKSIPRLKRTTHEIKVALEIVCESHDLAAAQVWIPYESPSSLEGIQTNKQMFAVKYIGYFADLDDDHLLSAVKDYYDTCDTLPLKIGQGLVGRTLETYKPHFCTDIYNPAANNEMWNKKLLGLLSATVECSCLVICLRSIDTGDVDYAFEFLWPRKRNYLILLESLFLTLKRCLPSFKFASGSIKLGDELLVLDVENSTGSGIGFLNILEGNRLSPLPKALIEARRQVAEDCMEVRGKTNPTLLPQEEDLKQLHAGRYMQKRKLSDMYDSHSESIEDNSMEVRGKTNSIPLLPQEEDLKQQHADRADEDFLLPFKVEYANEVLEFHLPTSLATVIALKNEINKRWELKSGTYKLKYLDEDGDWILMNSDEHLRNCIRSYRNIDGTPIRLLVPPLAP